MRLFSTKSRRTPERVAPLPMQRGAQAKRQQEKGELGSSKFETKALTRTAFPWQGALSAVR